MSRMFSCMDNRIALHCQKQSYEDRAKRFYECVSLHGGLYYNIIQTAMAEMEIAGFCVLFVIGVSWRANMQSRHWVLIKWIVF